MFEFLKPVSIGLVDFVNKLAPHTIGQNIDLYTNSGVPELKEGSLVLFSVSENRNNVNRSSVYPNFDNIRKSFYSLAKGDWNFNLVDVGEVAAGDTIEDTYFAVTEIVKKIQALKCIPITLGGGQDIVYSQYKAFDPEDGMINIVNVDSRFNLGNVELPITNQSFVGKIVIDQPYNLFNYTNIGYQSYYVSPEELDLLGKMFFDSYRLGQVINDLEVVEPVFRDANLVSLDLNSISAPFFGEEPNGFNGREICALSRYAGISDKVSVFGVYEYDTEKSTPVEDALVAQILWYFAEGVSCRWGESGEVDTMDVISYQVPIDDEVFLFYKSRLTERWWMNVRYFNNSNNNIPIDALLPCRYQDYELACNQVVPEIWYNAKMKHEM